MCECEKVSEHPSPSHVRSEGTLCWAAHGARVRQTLNSCVYIKKDNCYCANVIMCCKLWGTCRLGASRVSASVARTTATHFRPCISRPSILYTKLTFSPSAVQSHMHAPRETAPTSTHVHKHLPCLRFGCSAAFVQKRAPLYRADLYPAWDRWSRTLLSRGWFSYLCKYVYWWGL